MEDLPPSYETAIDRDVWSIVAPWMASPDLCAACLVNRQWHVIYAPILWGNPASHFGTQNDAVYVALGRFQTTLKRARLVVRQLTHTLHFPPAQPEIYGSPDVFWLSRVLEYLPKLQSLMVSHLAFFDHQSLVALRREEHGPQPSSLDNRIDERQCDLKLLLAKAAPNVTSIGLTEALLHFRRLMYLDLSYTSAAKDASVLSSVESLQNIQVLKLRGVGLRDREVEVLANAIGTRVRLLDVSQNQLTDLAVAPLLRTCFLPPGNVQASDVVVSRQIEEWPVGLTPEPGFLSLDLLRSENLDQELLKQLTHPLTGRLALEDIPHSGLTHLYIGDNALSIRGPTRLLGSARLHILDAVGIVGKTSRARWPSSSIADRAEIPSSDVQRLVSVLQTSACRNLTYLRLDHEAVLRAFMEKEIASPKSSHTERRSLEEGSMQELPQIKVPPAYEAYSEHSAESGSREAELPGGWINSPSSSSANVPRYSNNVSNQNASGQPERGSEVIKNQTSPSGCENGEEGSKASIANVPDLRLSAILHARIEYLLQKRPSRGLQEASSLDTPRSSKSIPLHSCNLHLHPSHLPNLVTIVLADVPAYVPDSSPLLLSLLHFISACADEAHLAFLQARTSCALPTSSHRRGAELQLVRSLFALKTIVLEMRGDEDASPIARPSGMPAVVAGKGESRGGGKSWESSRTNLHMLKSSTGDMDSEALWAAAENDFSFFSEGAQKGDREYDIYPDEPEERLGSDIRSTSTSRTPENESTHHQGGNSASSSPSSGLARSPTSIAPASPSDPPYHPTRPRRREQTTPPPPSSTKESKEPHPQQKPSSKTLDLIHELSQFRKAKREKYQDAIAESQRHPREGKPSSSSSSPPPFIEGHWEGEIKIVRGMVR